jgi:hypothetical protein
MQEQGNAVDLNSLVEKRVTVCGRGMIFARDYTATCTTVPWSK